MPDDNAPATGDTENGTGSATDASTETSGNSPELTDAGKRAIAAERKAAREAQRRADELASRLKAFEDRDKTEQQRAMERAETAEKALRDAESRAIRYEVAAEKGLSVKQAARLIGSTREELEADADELLNDLGVSVRRVPVPSFDQGARGTAAPADMNAALRRMAGRA